MAASVDVVSLEHAYGALRVVRGMSFRLEPGSIGWPSPVIVTLQGL